MRTILAFMLFFAVSLKAEMVITEMDNIENLAGSLIDDSSYIDPGVNIFNVTSSGDDLAFGYFSGGLSAGLGMDDGIVLSSGAVSYIADDNISPSTTTEFNLAGDTDLDGLIPGYTTYDAAVLEFDFTTDDSTAYFNYAFASEEYTEWVGSEFNDVFGFFIDGENYAIVPGVDEAVAINNVNQTDNSHLFNNNDIWHDSLNADDFDITFDGFTNTFTSKLTGLVAGQTYHLKIAVADAGDYILDSAVFLEAGSFSKTIVTPAGAPEPATWALIILSSAFVYYKKTRQELITLT
jgi:hypothetical protein